MELRESEKGILALKLQFGKDAAPKSFVDLLLLQLSQNKALAPTEVRYEAFQGQKQPRWVLLRLAEEQGSKLTAAEVCRKLGDEMLRVEVTESLKEVIPVYHGEAGPGTSLVKAALGLGLIECAFPVHDKAAAQNIWRSKNWSITSPPIEEIREYFGEYEAFYFAWVSAYVKATLLPGVAGALLWAWAAYYGITINDNAFAPLFGLAVALWSNCFIKYWSRSAVTLSFGWGTYGAEKKERVRPEFKGELRTSDITGNQERFFPYRARLLRFLVSVVVTGFMLAVALLVMFTLLNLQGYVVDPHSPVMVPALAKLAEPGEIFDPASTLSLVPVIGYSLVIMILNMVYRTVAEKLTDFENHRTETEYENALVFKRVFFEMFDCYAALLYVAFYRLEVVRLREEVLALFTADEIRRVAVESIIPFILRWWNHRSKQKELEAKKKKDDSFDLAAAALEEEADAEQPEAFDDYLELVVQFGYVCLFAAACPLAAALAVISNVIEIRSDIFKLCFVCRRPRPSPASNIPTAWFSVLSFVAYASVLTNCLIIACTSQQMRDWFPHFFDIEAKKGLLIEACTAEDEGCVERAIKEANQFPVAPGVGHKLMSSVFLFEHLLLVLCYIIRSLIPQVPKKVRTALKKQEYLNELKASTLENSTPQ